MDDEIVGKEETPVTEQEEPVKSISDLDVGDILPDAPGPVAAEVTPPGKDDKLPPKPTKQTRHKEIRADDQSIITETRKVLQREPKVRVMIASTETEKQPVDVAINGYTYRIARDNEVEVPESVLEVLRNAQYEIFTQKERTDGGEGIEMVPSFVARFPMQIVR